MNHVGEQRSQIAIRVQYFVHMRSENPMFLFGPDQGMQLQTGAWRIFIIYFGGFHLRENYTLICHKML